MTRSDEPHARAPGRTRELSGHIQSALGLDGVLVLVMTGPDARAVVAATTPAARALDALQFDLGEGPCLDAATTGRPVLVPDLASPRALRTWPALAPAALELGVRATFAHPLAQDGTVFGVLDLCRTAPGPLTPDQAQAAAVLAGATAAAVLADSADDVDRDAVDLRTDAERARVHQAAGSIAVTLGVGLEEAMVRLRAAAYADGSSLTAAAAEVLAGRHRFGLRE